MGKKFWENAGGELAKQWNALLLGPAFIFWLVVTLLVSRPIGWDVVWRWLTAGDTFAVAARLAGGLLLVYYSSQAVRRFNPAALQLLEGYFPRPLEFIIRPMRRRQKRRRQVKMDQWQALRQALRRAGKLTSAGQRQLAVLEEQLHDFPTGPEEIMPTALGNILRAGETIPRDKYGLDTVTCWPRLWLLVSDAARAELTEARQRLDGLVSWWLWGLVSLVWMVWLPWLGLFSLLWLTLAYRLMLSPARLYASLVEAVFDVYRWELYAHLHLPPPATPEAEIEAGRQLTAYLRRGTGAVRLTFTAQKE